MIPTSGLSLDQAPPLSIPFRFFGTAPVFMAAAGILLMLAGGGLLDVPLMGETVALAHLAVLGWITMTMFGALYQMIPVLGAIPVPWQGGSRLVHVLLVLGVASLALGVGADLHRWFLLSASLGLGGAVVLFVLQIGVALARTRVTHPAVHAMRLSAVALVVTLTFGGIFLGEYAHGFFPWDRAAMVGAHLVWGLVGWVGVLIVGVSFQVLPMFYMMPAYPTRQAAWTLWGLALTLFTVPLALFLAPRQPLWQLASGLPGIAGILLYALTFRKLFAQRRRKVVDATILFWRIGFSAGAVACLLLAVWPFRDEEVWRFLFGLFYIGGFATAIILGMLYKIIPFLVWFHRFSRLAGLVEIPMMDDLVREKSARFHAWLTLGFLLVTAAALVTRFPPLFVLSGLCLVVMAGLMAHALWFAVRHHPPAMPDMPDFASFFKGMERPE